MSYGLPDYLQDDAPFLVCDICGRKSWAMYQEGHVCEMIQPNQSRCHGILRDLSTTKAEGKEGEIGHGWNSWRKSSRAAFKIASESFVVHDYLDGGVFIRWHRRGYFCNWIRNLDADISVKASSAE